MQRKIAAEVVGTFVLVLGGCGSAVLAGSAIGAEGVALAFGLTVLVMAFAVGPISGGHFNPAVTIGLVVGKRFEARDVPYYIVAQVAGAVAAGAVLYLIASGLDGFDAADGFAANGYDDHSPAGYSLLAGLVAEIALTAIFLVVIIGATARSASPGFAPIAIGFALTLIHLVSIPVTNTSVNPARSTGVALFVGEGWAIGQLWLFWVAPIVGGAGGALVWRYLLGSASDMTD
ncbi:MAG TPA: aquaporin Z [Tepidiformaceae bacterium]|nr:aquaporin Z [Tepidiformaceae bacterium]